MPAKLTDKQKITLWQQRRIGSYLASCRLEGMPVAEAVHSEEPLEQQLEALRRQYGG